MTQWSTDASTRSEASGSKHTQWPTALINSDQQLPFVKLHTTHTPGVSAAWLANNSSDNVFTIDVTYPGVITGPQAKEELLEKCPRNNKLNLPSLPSPSFYMYIPDFFCGEPNAFFAACNVK
ncbi:hypothetical protein ACTXT7_012217 [Hymenolepis weldensis]